MSDLALLTEAARTAGEIARRFWRGENRVWDKGSAGPVSEADLAVDAHLKDVLLSARPGYGWLSEETEDTAERRAGDALFVCDPIDGTRAFLKGEESWSHALAVVRDGQVVAGVVHLPARKLMYSAAQGEGATLNGRPLRASSRDALSGAHILANRGIFSDTHWDGPVPDTHRAFRPSVAYRLALVAEARFDGMVTLRPSWEWDIAAGSLIASEAGARTTDRRGAPLRFDNADPRVDGVIAAAPNVHRELVTGLVRA